MLRLPRRVEYSNVFHPARAIGFVAGALGVKWWAAGLALAITPTVLGFYVIWWLGEGGPIAEAGPIAGFMFVYVVTTFCAVLGGVITSKKLRQQLFMLGLFLLLPADTFSADYYQNGFTDHDLMKKLKTSE
jgi:hypothetical protein